MMTLEEVAAFSRKNEAPLKLTYGLLGNAGLAGLGQGQMSPITIRDIKRLPLIAEQRRNVARNLVDCRRVNTRLARVARNQLKEICRVRNLAVW